MDHDPEPCTDTEIVQRIESLIDLRDAIGAACPPQEPRRLVPTRAEAMEVQAWHAVIDAARDLVAFADGLCIGPAPPIDRKRPFEARLPSRPVDVVVRSGAEGIRTTLWIALATTRRASAIAGSRF